MMKTMEKAEEHSTNPLAVVLVGCSGRMARANLKAIFSNQNFSLIGILENNEEVAVLGASPAFMEISENLEEKEKALAAKIPVVSSVHRLMGKLKNPEKLLFLDFSLPHATLMHLHACEKILTPTRWVIGTTGFSKSEEVTIAQLAKKIPTVKAGNFSIGINLLLKICGDAAKVMEKADVEIVETHHRAKVDAPSGTALMLADAVNRVRNLKPNLSRFSNKSARTVDEIGFSSLRGGAVVGEHEVQFLGKDESLFLGHRAENRALFSNGALAAALWLDRKEVPGLYSMADVLASW